MVDKILYNCDRHGAAYGFDITDGFEEDGTTPVVIATFCPHCIKDMMKVRSKILTEEDKIVEEPQE